MEKTFDQRLDAALEAEAKVWEEAGIRKEIFIAFPEHETMPKIAALAVWMIRAFGGVFRVGFHDKE